jgi:aspartyl protease family protein
MAMGFTGFFQSAVMKVAALCLSGWAVGVWAGTAVSISGTLGDKALISINGGPAKVVAVGGQLGGVRILAVQGDRVTVEVDGQRRTLGVGLGDAFASHRAAPDKTSGGHGSLVLTADGQGQFSTQVEVNGIAAPFLVDTGASVVTLPASLARRANIDLERATPIHITTANGRAKAWRVMLNSVKAGGLGASLVEAVVVDDAKLPFALLGMSFLNRMDMHREGDSLTLVQRY